MAEIKLEAVVEEEPIDNETAERIVGRYIEDYGELPTKTFEKTHRKPLDLVPLPENINLIELAAILRIRPKFLDRATKPGQIKWLKKKFR